MLMHIPIGKRKIITLIMKGMAGLQIPKRKTITVITTGRGCMPGKHQLPWRYSRCDSRTIAVNRNRALQDIPSMVPMRLNLIMVIIMAPKVTMVTTTSTLANAVMIIIQRATTHTRNM